MNELSKIDKTMSSREIAELATKQHAHVMEAIRAMEPAWTNVTQSVFRLGYYRDGNGQKRPMYILSKVESLYIATKFNDEARAKVILRWEELEISKAEGEFQIPQTLSAALMLAAKQAEQLELNEATLKEQAPKVLFADSVTTSKDSILIGDLAKIMKQNGIDIGQNRLFEWMRNNGFLCRSGSKWNRPTQRAMEMGLFEVLQRTINIPNSEPRIQITTKCTGTGQIYFINKFLK